MKYCFRVRKLLYLLCINLNIIDGWQGFLLQSTSLRPRMINQLDEMQFTSFLWISICASSESWMRAWHMSSRSCFCPDCVEHVQETLGLKSFIQILLKFQKWSVYLTVYSPNHAEIHQQKTRFSLLWEDKDEKSTSSF